MATPLISDMAVFQRKLATLPLVTYRAGESVLTAGSTTGRLLILKEGAVEVVANGRFDAGVRDESDDDELVDAVLFDPCWRSRWSTNAPGRRSRWRRPAD